MTDNERLFIVYNALKEQGLINTYVELSEALKTNKAGINDLKSGKKKVTIDNLRSMKLSYPDVSIDFLLSEEGEPLISEKASVKEVLPEETFLLKTDNKDYNEPIPLYNMEASAGLVQLFNKQQNVVDYITIPNLPKCDGALYVTGDSMYPLLKSGDIVMYKQVNDLEHGIYFGEMYLLSIVSDHDEYTTVKYIQKSEKGEAFVKLVSQNTHHSPKDIPLKYIKAIALIKASIRINSMT